MKTLVIVVAILGSSLFNTTSAEETLSMDDELKKVVKFDNNQLQMEKNETAFVKISFKINEAGKVEILDMNYSDESIKSLLTEKLFEMNIKKNQNNGKVYNYNFTFKKM